MDLRALKARRDLDADAVTRSLQGTKIYAKKQARATTMDVGKTAACGKDMGYDVHARQADTARSLRRAAEFHPPQTAVSG